MMATSRCGATSHPSHWSHMKGPPTISSVMHGKRASPPSTSQGSACTSKKETWGVVGVLAERAATVPPDQPSQFMALRLKRVSGAIISRGSWHQNDGLRRQACCFSSPSAYCSPMKSLRILAMLLVSGCVHNVDVRQLVVAAE